MSLSHQLEQEWAPSGLASTAKQHRNTRSTHNVSIQISPKVLHYLFGNILSLVEFRVPDYVNNKEWFSEVGGGCVIHCAFSSRVSCLSMKRIFAWLLIYIYQGRRERPLLFPSL